MAMTVHIFLKANGTDIKGDSTIESMDRKDSIECLSFSDSVRTAREASSGMATGDRTYGPITITKRIDKSSPLLAKALCNNEVIEGDFKFYRPSPTGDGTTEQFYTITIQEGRISSINRISPDVTNPASATDPAKETVSFVAGYYRWTYEPDGVEHIDHWSQRT
jgi:type VI secretion system secreted protein Hcp